MRLTHLSLTNFRNFARLDVDVPAGPVLLVGGNAQGKTSLLEAVYYLATFESFHAGNDRQLINFVAGRDPLAVGRIVADFHLDRPATGRAHGRETHRLEVRLIQESDPYEPTARLRKEILLDGVKRKVGEAIGSFNAVLFLPHMLRVLEGPPDERRRYLNLAVSQVDRRYALALAEYTKVLTQRNALLKQLGERGGDPGQLEYWDERLALYGAQIIHTRIQAVQELERLAARTHLELTRSEEVLRLAYQPSYDPLPRRSNQFALPIQSPSDRSGLALEKIQAGFRECLAQARPEDTARGATSLGPHRDELRFLGNGIDLGMYGSRGQARTTVLSLKLAEVAWMHARTGQWPVLLLDEVLAELDSERRADLLARLADCEQALMTTTDADSFSHEFSARAAVWRIHAGRLEEHTPKE
jgi:DNA replication and repair protein RecF